MLWDVLSLLYMTGMICVESVVGEIDLELGLESLNTRRIILDGVRQWCLVL